jgi:hypothetical protein
MARFSFNEADNYGAQKNTYFSLKDNGDTAKIRFLYNDIDDVQGVATHEIEVDGKRMDVECLRAYNEPVDNCPLCKAGYKVNAKIFIPVYDINSKESKIWTRGKSFFPKLSSLTSRYKPLVATPFEIERVGKKGDTSTTYETYPMQTDNARIEDFPEISAEGTCFQSKTFEELNYFLDTGLFPDEVKNRAETRQDNRTQTRPAPRGREMPATPIRRRPNYDEEDSF